MNKTFLRFLHILPLCVIGLYVSAHDIEVPNADGVTIYYNYINAGTELEVTFLGDWYGLHGTKNGYNGYARADFIKAMFPDVMKDIEQDSIRNFKFQADRGNIVIDEPDKDDYHFHVAPLFAKR